MDKQVIERDRKLLQMTRRVLKNVLQEKDYDIVDFSGTIVIVAGLALEYLDAYEKEQLKAEEWKNRCHTLEADWTSMLGENLDSKEKEQDGVLAKKLRPELKWFAGVMEDRLQANDHKDGWHNLSIMELLLMLDKERRELFEAYLRKPSHAIVEEAADVANFAMMIAGIAAEYAKGQREDNHEARCREG